MTGLEEAKKKFWYDSNFDKQDNHLDHYLDLLTFEQGFKAALEWALTQEQSVSGLLPEFTVAIVPSLDIRRELEETENEV